MNLVNFNEFIAWIQTNPQAAAILLPAIFTAVGGLISQLLSWRDKGIKKMEYQHKEKELEQQEKLRELQIREAELTNKEKEENLRHLAASNRKDEEIKQATLDNIKADTALKKIDTKIKEREDMCQRNEATQRAAEAARRAAEAARRLSGNNNATNSTNNRNRNNRNSNN